MSSINAGGDSEEKARLGQAAWVVIGRISALVITFVAVVMQPASLMRKLATEIAEEPATSGPSHYTTSGNALPDLTSSNRPPSSANNSIDQNSDTALTYRRSTSTVLMPSLPQNTSQDNDQ